MDKKFKTAVRSCPAAVLYSPFGDEPDPLAIRGLSGIVPMRRLMVPPTAGEDPKALAERYRTEVGQDRACIFVPGRWFDSRGTRIGRGGGWYDRFLKAVPRDWVRIGVCDRSRFSAEPLPLQEWDEPMDWIAVCDHRNFEAIETNARSPFAEASGD